MAVLKKNIIRENPDTKEINCFIKHEDNTVLCNSCIHSKHVPFTGMSTCDLKSHHVNENRPGYVCKDFDRKE